MYFSKECEKTENEDSVYDMFQIRLIRRLPSLQRSASLLPDFTIGEAVFSTGSSSSISMGSKSTR